MKPLPTLKQFEYLTSLAETRHFARAAERCNITPSTLSAGIRDLEDVLGVAVAERTKRSVLITPIGHAVAERAQQLLRDAQDIMELASLQGEPMTGGMNFGAIPTISPFVLPNTLPAIEAKYPKLRLYLREEQTDVLLSRLQNGQLDAALIALPYKTGKLIVRVLFEDNFVFACRTDHRLARQKSIKIDDIPDQSLLLLEEGHCLHGHALDACRLHMSPVRAQFEATSLQTLVQMVASGIGVTLLPKTVINARMLSMDKLRLIPLHTPTSRQIALVWRGSSPRVSELELLAEFFQKT